MKFHRWLKNLPFYWFIPIMLGVLFVITVLKNSLQLNPGDNPISSEYGLWERIIVGSIVVPLLETLILQLLPIELILRIKLRKRIAAIIAIMVSALAFASTHWFNLHYVLHAFVFGLVFAEAYLICRDKKNRWYAFGVVATIHALWNGFVTFEVFLF